MDSCSIILSKDRTSGYVRLIGIFCILCNAVIFLQFWFNSNSAQYRNIGLFGIAICILAVILSLIRGIPIIRHTTVALFSFSVAGLLLIFTGSYYLGFCDMLLAAAAYYVSQPARIMFSEKGVELPLLFSGFQDWGKFSNVILKDNVLTLDFRNNKLMQMVIDPALNPAIREESFNAFCQGRLSDIIEAP